MATVKPLRSSAQDAKRTPPASKRSLDALSVKPLRNYVSFLKNGLTLQFRSSWDDDNDVVNECLLSGSYNALFEFNKIFLVDKNTAKNVVTTGNTIKAVVDDIAPVYINGSYRGGNHGHLGAWTITLTAHGKTIADIGSVWTDGNNVDFVILQVPTANTLFVCTEYNSNPQYPLGTDAPVAPLTHKSGATHTDQIAFTVVSSISQIRPSINNRTVRILVNGLHDFDVNLDDVAYGDYVDVIESYGVVDIPAMLTYLKTNAGSNNNQSFYSDAIADVCIVNITYRFGEHGTCVLYESVEYLIESYISYMGFTQSDSTGVSDKIYIPGTDYDSIVDTNGVNFVFTEDTWNTVNVPPNRYFQLKSDLSFGYGIGYCPSIGYGVTALRNENLLYDFSAGMCPSSTHKMYPYLVRSISASAGQSFEAVAFRVPIQQYDADFTVCAWYWVDDDVYLMLDAHKTLSKVIDLPEYLHGYGVTVIEKTDNITILDNTVPISGLPINVTDYGSVVLKLTR